MRYIATCTYCGKEWQETVWSKDALHNLKCECKSSVRKFRQIEEAEKDAFGYRFDPPFPEPEKPLEITSYTEYPDDYWNNIGSAD